MKIQSNTILLMFSGGLDSLGCLYLLLTEPKYKDYEIHVHHIEIINSEKRNLAETLAVNKIVQYFKDKGKRFSYSSSTFEGPAINGTLTWDMDIYNFMAGIICAAAPSIKSVAIGRTKTDMLTLNTLPIERSDSILNLFKQDCKILPVIDYTKEEIWNFLPEDLRILAWSCRFPSYINGTPIACGRCKPCKELHF